MKERPILMTPENAQKCFLGTKTQTRRIVKQKHLPFLESLLNGLLDGKWNQRPLPYGQVGDRLWIREAWQVDAPHDGTWADTQFYGCNGSPLSDIPERYQKPEHCLFSGSWTGTPLKWRPSIHMPKWACRTWVTLTGVRVERLQAITEEDAKAEGCLSDERMETWWQGYDSTMTDRDGNLMHTQAPRCEQPPDWMLEPKKMVCRFGNNAKDNFRMLWESINPGTWEQNPWVWVLTFKKESA